MRPQSDLLGKVVRCHWRDSYQETDLNFDDIAEDCVWEHVGFVVRTTKLFLTLAYGRSRHRVTDAGKLAEVLSIPWTQVLEVKELR